VTYFLGIDAGGSKTTAVIADEKSVLGRATSGASNMTRVGEEQARVAIQKAVLDACTIAKISPPQIQYTSIGASGGGRPAVSDALRGILAEVVGGAIEIVGDTLITLDAAFPGEAGIIVIAGTGSIAFGRNARRETARAGGWGYAISDEGSGYWIGRAAVSALFRAFDERAETALTQLVFSNWNVTDINQLVPLANANPAPNFAALFPIVVTAADQGDATARLILTQAGHELARQARTVASRLFVAGDAVRLAMSGGVFTNSAMVRQAFSSSFQAQEETVTILPQPVDPAHGALARARSMAKAAIVE
jgi:N-acetylglucosamine kinase-like BadF-type ATPase